MIDDIEGFYAEFFYNTFGHLRAQTFYQSGTQIFLNAVNCCWNGGLIGMNLELVTIF